MLRVEAGSVKDTVKLPVMAFRGTLAAVFASGHGRRATLLLAGILLAGPPACRAVLFKSTGDTNYNTTAPGGTLTNSGWELQGWWLGSYLGTPIAPTYFVSAKHVGGTVGNVLGLGLGYHTTAYFDDPNSDLRIWKVAETFPVYALLYTNTDEVGKHCVVFGRGRQRGSPVIVSGVTNGWQWGTGDTVVRWGENDVSGTANGASLLRAAFDRDGGSNECHLTVGDSGGAMFIQDNSNVWRLAGIHYAVDGPFSNTTYGVINAALLDRGGLCQQNGTNWTCFTDIGPDSPSGFYSTRISQRVAWINSVIDFLPGKDLAITAVTPAGTNIQISFTTGTNKVYEIERRDSLTSGGWTTLTNGVVGTGDIMTITDVGAATLPNRFYRIGLMPVLP